MSLVAYTITALELNQADATASGKQVVVGASCSMFIQPANTVVLLYDDASGSNGSTAKTTGINGQVTVYIDSGDYRVSTNSVSRYVTVTSFASLPTFGTAATADVTTSPIDTTADRLLKVGDFGVGELLSVGYPITNIDTATGVAGGMYRYVDTNTGTLPAGFNGFGNIWVSKYDANNASQIIVDLNGKSAFRHIPNDGAQAWSVNLTTTNTSTNVFLVNSGKVLKSIGISVLTTAVDFDVDAMGLTDPLTITKSGGFNIIDATTGSSVASSVLPALHSTSSARNAVLRFTVTGATIGGLYRAVAATNSSITVNF